MLLQITMQLHFSDLIAQVMHSTLWSIENFMQRTQSNTIKTRHCVKFYTRYIMHEICDEMSTEIVSSVCIDDNKEWWLRKHFPKIAGKNIFWILSNDNTGQKSLSSLLHAYWSLMPSWWEVWLSISKYAEDFWWQQLKTLLKPNSCAMHHSLSWLYILLALISFFLNVFLESNYLKI